LVRGVQRNTADLRRDLARIGDGDVQLADTARIITLIPSQTAGPLLGLLF
jgi:hypothetical protein